MQCRCNLRKSGFLDICDTKGRKLLWTLARRKRAARNIKSGDNSQHKEARTANVYFCFWLLLLCAFEISSMKMLAEGRGLLLVGSPPQLRTRRWNYTGDLPSSSAFPPALCVRPAGCITNNISSATVILMIISWDVSRYKLPADLLPRLVHLT